MSVKRIALTCLGTAAVVLVQCAPALATTHAGEGIFGPTDDQIVTNAMFLTMAFFVVVIVVFSLLQGWLEHRKHARVDAARRRASSTDWKGGW